MEMRHDNVGEVRRVVLVGRLDTAGVDVVETRFGAAIVPNGKDTIVDLSGVTFLASMGIRMLISTTRALSRKGGRLGGRASARRPAAARSASARKAARTRARG